MKITYKKHGGESKNIYKKEGRKMQAKEISESIVRILHLETERSL
jgi:hypothetical protein